eukprot:gene5891-11226_t
MVKITSFVSIVHHVANKEVDSQYEPTITLDTYVNRQNRREKPKRDACSEHKFGVMLGFVKKEEVSSMTEPLISTHNGDINISYEDDELVKEIISSISGPSHSSTCTDFISNGLFGQQNGSIYFNSSQDVYCNGNVLGVENADFIGDEVDTSAISENRNFEINYIKFPKSIIKSQRRSGGVSQQRLSIEDSRIVLGITLLGVAQVLTIRCFVARVVDPSFQRSDVVNEPVELEVKALQGKVGEYILNINLDSVYDVNGKLVYGLAKNKIEDLNKFYLKILVTFVDHSWNFADTKCFQVVGRAKDADKKEPVTEANQLPPAPRPGAKRARTGTDESTQSNGSLSIGDMPKSNVSTSSGYSSGTSHTDGMLITASKVAADFLDAKRAEIGSLVVAEPIKTSRGDIAYHFTLQNPDAHPAFSEGEIVGLFERKDGECVLDKLTQKNSIDAVLKGVISRSQYLEAKVKPGVRTETVCMFGIVPVKVRGPVTRGDIVYASPSHPGVAVSSSTLGSKPLLINDSSALGMAWQTIYADEDELNLVYCLASITMEIFQGMIEKRFRTLKRRVNARIDDIQKSRKRSKRRNIICASILTTFLLLLSILLWQIFMPGSALRRMVCEKGSIKNHFASFKYRPLKDIFTFYNVDGKEFDFETLKKKSQELREPIPGSGEQILI